MTAAAMAAMSVVCSVLSMAAPMVLQLVDRLDVSSADLLAVTMDGSMAATLVFDLAGYSEALSADWMVAP